jgi:hypothetical protein
MVGSTSLANGTVRSLIRRVLRLGRATCPVRDPGRHRLKSRVDGGAANGSAISGLSIPLRPIRELQETP